MPSLEPQPTAADGQTPAPATSAPASDEQPRDALTDQERAIVQLEKKRFRYQGSKEQAIQKELGLSPVAYYQQLNAMIDNPRVIRAEPALTRRLREHRDALS